MSIEFSIRRAATLTDREREALADLLVDGVDGGAEVGFLSPLARSEALAYWRALDPKFANGERALLLAEDAGRAIVGTVQLGLAMPPNQPHRAEVMKMLVHTRAREAGVGTALMLAAEAQARAAGKSLLVLDTANPKAERLYERLGWIAVGSIPRFALRPHGGYSATKLYYRQLD